MVKLTGVLKAIKMRCCNCNTHIVTLDGEARAIMDKKFCFIADTVETALKRIDPSELESISVEPYIHHE